MIRRVAAAFAGLLILGCPDPPDPQDDDDTAADDDDDDVSADDDDATLPPAPELPPVQAQPDPLCRRGAPEAAADPWHLAVEWETGPVDPNDRDRPQWSTAPGAVLVMEDDARPIVVQTDYTFPSDEVEFNAARGLIRGLDGTGGVLWSHWTDQVEVAGFTGAATGICLGTYLGEPSIYNDGMALYVDSRWGMTWALWPQVFDIQGVLVAGAQPEPYEPSPFGPTRPGQSPTPYRATWQQEADCVFRGNETFCAEPPRVLEQATLGLVERETFGRSWPWSEYHVADIDLDGDIDLPSSPGVFYDAATAMPVWEPLGFSGTLPVMVPMQTDCDPLPEVLLVDTDDDAVRLHDDDGRELWEYAAPFAIDSVPTIADLDGDRVPEVVFRGTGAQYVVSVVALRSDGSELWTFQARQPLDSLMPASLPAHDFDGDGAAEVVARTIDRLFILDGRTGAVRVETELFQLNYDSPTIADIDLDGEPEILTRVRGDWDRGEHPDRGLVVLGSGDGTWAPSGTEWTWGPYRPADALRGYPETGGLPPYWLEHPGVRQQLTHYPLPPPEDALPDPELATVHVDRSACPRALRVYAAVRNRGTADLAEETPVELRSGEQRWAALVPPLASGELQWVEFVLPGDAEPAGEVELLYEGEQCDVCDDVFPVVGGCGG